MPRSIPLTPLATSANGPAKLLAVVETSNLGAFDVGEVLGIASGHAVDGDRAAVDHTLPVDGGHGSGSGDGESAEGSAAVGQGKGAKPRNTGNGSVAENRVGGGIALVVDEGEAPAADRDGGGMGELVVAGEIDIATRSGQDIVCRRLTRTVSG